MSSQKYYVGSQAASIKTVPKLRPYDGVKIITGKTEEDSETGDSYAIVYKSHDYPRDDSNAHILVISNPLGSTEQANRIFDRIQHYEHQPFTASDAHLDIHAQLGDAVTIKGVYGPIISQDIDFTSGIKVSDISSPNGDETDNEFGIRAGTSSERALERAFETIVTQFGIEEGHIWSFIADPQNGLSSKIDQTADHITLMVHEETTRATDEEAAIREYYDSQIQMTANSITAEVNHRIEEDEALQSQIQMTDNNITAEVNHRIEDIATLRSQIQMTADSIMASVMGEYVDWHAEDSAHHQINFQLYGYGHPDTSGYYAYDHQNEYYIDRSNGYYYKSKITDTAVNWITGQYTVDIYGYGPPDPGQYNPKACNGQYYLDQSTGKLYLAGLRTDGYNWKVEATLERQTTNTWGWVYEGQAEPDATSAMDKVSAEIQVTQNSIISTVAADGASKSWVIPNKPGTSPARPYTISFYGYGNPNTQLDAYPVTGNIGKYYLDQSNGNIYVADNSMSGPAWRYEAQCTDLVNDRVSSSIEQFANSIRLSVTDDAGETTFTLKAGTAELDTETFGLHVKSVNIEGEVVAAAVKTGEIRVANSSGVIDEYNYLKIENGGIGYYHGLTSNNQSYSSKAWDIRDEVSSSNPNWHNLVFDTGGLVGGDMRFDALGSIVIRTYYEDVSAQGAGGIYLMNGYGTGPDPHVVFDTLPDNSYAANGRIIFVKA